MTTDPATLAGLVTREIHTGSREGVATKIAVARRTYPTHQDDLWDALTNPDRIPRWFLPVTGDLQPGGRYQLEGNAGGVVESCEAPASFSVTWEMGPDISWLSVHLSPSGTGTTLELRHEAAVPPEMWDQFGPGAVGVGWDLGLHGLGLHVESGAAVDPDTAVTFPASPDGRAFVRRAAEGWAAAAIAAGDAPEAARQAAERTVAFYTGDTEESSGD